jgi:agmatinase
MRGAKRGRAPRENTLIGFGGAAVRALKDLPEQSSGDACIFGIDSEICRMFGASNKGAAAFIRKSSARMHPWTRRERPGATDIGLLRGRPQQLMEECIRLGAGLSARGFVPVAVGCDHTFSYAHALGTCRDRRATYLYFDAHLDLGLHDDRRVPPLHNGNFIAALVSSGRFDRVVNVGARSWSTHDEAYAGEMGVTVLRAPALEELAFLRGSDVYVSIDTDVLDPAFVPNTCCREPFGLTPRELLSMLSWVGQNCRVVGVDLSELVPDAEATHTAEIAMRCVHELLIKKGER